ncbi:MAG: hypothetical protein KGI38_02630 [Thaumarchaeota archaeon]|nr:hypothetical protein [Nitrososphaerota archaeon]
MSFSESASRLSQELEKFGLNRATAKTYVALLGNGESSANTLSKASGIHRVDVYKRLEELTRLGFVNVQLGRPSLYEASDPEFVLDAITEAKKGEMNRLSAMKATLLPQLKVLMRTRADASHGEGRDVYKLIAGRSKGYEEAKRLVRTANEEILRVVSSTGLVRNYKFGVLDEYKLCSERGVKIRIISDLSKVPRKVIRFCLEHFELRHSTESSMRLLVVDRSALLFSAVFNDTDMTKESTVDRYLLVKDEKIARIIAIFFEHLWAASTPATLQGTGSRRQSGATGRL